MEQSSVLKSKQLPFWYLSTVVEENRCEGWPRQGGQRGQAVSAAGPAAPQPSAPRSLGPGSAPHPCWGKEPAKGGMKTRDPTSRKCHLYLP